MDALRGRRPSPFEDTTLSGRFATLLETLHRRSGRRVVVLVDEYDKPILDAIDEPQLAETNRDDLRGLYGTLKACDAHVEMTFITGVSKFSKVSLFSDLNNLIDLTLDPAYAAVCGYTEADLNAVFAPELPGLDRDEIRAWYNGYDWLGGEQDRVYNPFGLLKLFRTRLFRAQASMDGVAAEDATSRGGLDLAVRLGGNAYLFEFKVAERSEPGAALAQLQARGYADKHRAAGRSVHLIGVEISAESRDIMVFETAPG